MFNDDLSIVQLRIVETNVLTVDMHFPFLFNHGSTTLIVPIVFRRPVFRPSTEHTKTTVFRSKADAKSWATLSMTEACYLSSKAAQAISSVG